jgi:sulfide dehydrogenase [flavocytochrome c] flavoprotein subunit
LHLAASALGDQVAEYQRHASNVEGSTMKRRDFLAVSAGVLASTALGLPRPARAETARVVVIGGGFGGAPCARYLRQLNPGLQVTLVERDPIFYTCPFSNLVLAGLRRMQDIAQDFGQLSERHGVRVVQGSVTEVDPVKRRVLLADGSVLDADRLVLSPGIDLRWDAIPGYDQAVSEQLPHAWQAGTQTELLRAQLGGMPDGGVVIIAPPGEPYRCPPGPYERASLIAHYLSREKPRSKLLILDAKDAFSKQSLFTAAWELLYPGMIEWVSGSSGGLVSAVEAASSTLVTSEGFEKHRGDVVNLIPPQQAGTLARAADLSDETGWCPVDQANFESMRFPGVHVIGDACIAGAMPKSAFSANSQAKACAAAIVAELRGESLPTPSHVNTCYSLAGPDYGISVAAVYRLQEGKIVAVEGAGGVSPADVPADFRSREARYAEGWYASIVADTWG